MNDQGEGEGAGANRWLVTGGCGFIGRNLVAWLLSAGVPPGAIRVLDNGATCGADDLASAVGKVAEDGAWEGRSVALRRVDIRAREPLHACLAGATRVVHLAGSPDIGPSVEDPFVDCELNVTGTLNVLEAARRARVERFVLGSSMAPLGAAEPPVHEGMAPHPSSPYGASKLGAEAYALAYANCFGLDTRVLRFANAYGPHGAHKDGIVPMFIRRALRGEPWEIHGDGTATRDYVHVDDLSAAVHAAATRSGAGERRLLHIATGRETSVGELAALLREALRARGVADVPIVNRPPRTGDVGRNFTSIERAREVLDWAPETELREGLARTVDWFLERDHAIAASSGS